MKPKREHATNNRQTYFVTSPSWERRPLFRHQRWAELFIKVLYEYRENAYFLHEFVLMPDHFHLLITPKTSLERAAGLLKGGFSYQAKKQLNSKLEVWQPGFTDHRIRDAADYANHVEYIHFNPVRKHLCAAPEQYPYSSANRNFVLDPAPQRLKPASQDHLGTAKAVPLQSGPPDSLPLQSGSAQDMPLPLKKAAGGSH